MPEKQYEKKMKQLEETYNDVTEMFGKVNQGGKYKRLFIGGVHDFCRTVRSMKSGAYPDEFMATAEQMVDELMALMAKIN